MSSFQLFPHVLQSREFSLFLIGMFGGEWGGHLQKGGTDRWYHQVINPIKIPTEEGFENWQKVFVLTFYLYVQSIQIVILSVVLSNFFLSKKVDFSSNLWTAPATAPVPNHHIYYFTNASMWSHCYSLCNNTKPLCKYLQPACCPNFLKKAGTLRQHATLYISIKL